MKRIFNLLLAAGVIALGVWLWFFLFPRPEQIIRARIAKLAGDASFTSEQSPLAIAYAAQKLGGYFSTNVEVKLDMPGKFNNSFTGRDEIVQAAVVARPSVMGLKVEFPDVNVTVAPDKNSAVADVTLKATVYGEHDTIVQELKFTFEKTDGQWLIKKVETVHTLSQNHILNFEPAGARHIIFG
jgi:hypothetical protein